jgi:hypothetical protein
MVSDVHFVTRSSLLSSLLLWHRELVINTHDKNVADEEGGEPDGIVVICHSHIEGHCKHNHVQE